MPIRGILPLVLGLALHPATKGQFAYDQMSAWNQAAIQQVLQRPDFTFQTRTPPARVRVEIMERLFDHPRLAAAMWRECQFVPTLYAFEKTEQGLTIDDTRGLKGTLTLASRKPGERMYYIEGRVEAGRMGNPFPVGARMVIIYKYWNSPQGFESHIQTWTVLDSALLSFVTRPWRSYIQRRQQEFIAYIMNNMAQGGAFAEVSPMEFRGPLLREGDPVAIRQFEEVFGRRGHGGNRGGQQR
jgi:hypothetical protein